MRLKFSAIIFENFFILFKVLSNRKVELSLKPILKFQLGHFKRALSMWFNSRLHVVSPAMKKDSRVSSSNFPELRGVLKQFADFILQGYTERAGSKEAKCRIVI